LQHVGYIKMQDWNPRNVILLGFVLVLMGAVLPFLMVMHIIQPTYLLVFLTYGASVAGLVLGVIGGSMYVRKRKK